MITRKLYEKLDTEERKLWHSHDFEARKHPQSLSPLDKNSCLKSQNKRGGSDTTQVKSGILIMPNPNVPAAVWEIAKTEEMKEVIGLHGNTYHLWQVDRGDTLPLGKPELMMSITEAEQVSFAKYLCFLQG
jgi:hypothetical protein